jgi:hypothetical protein
MNSQVECKDLQLGLSQCSRRLQNPTGSSRGSGGDAEQLQQAADWLQPRTDGVVGSRRAKDGANVHQLAGAAGLQLAPVWLQVQVRSQRRQHRDVGRLRGWKNAPRGANHHLWPVPMQTHHQNCVEGGQRVSFKIFLAI